MKFWITVVDAIGRQHRGEGATLDDALASLQKDLSKSMNEDATRTRAASAVLVQIDDRT